MRSTSMNDSTPRTSHTAPTPNPWERSGSRGRSFSQDDGSRSFSRDDSYKRDSRDNSSQRERMDLMGNGPRQQHSRNDSGAASSGEFSDWQQQSTGRRHDYDVQAMESDLSPRPGTIKNPIPAPIVTIRSEFPTLNRSRQQQPLTCLVTVEVPDGNWRPDMDDLRFVPPNGQPTTEEISSPVRSPVRTSSTPAPSPYEAQENLDEIAEELNLRVDNWHGLEFQRWVTTTRTDHAGLC